MSESPKYPSYHNMTIERKIAAGLDRISQAFRILLWNEARNFGLTPIQIQVLIFLRFHTHAYCKVSYLAREFNMTKATISEVIKVLGGKALITKRSEKADGRSFTIHLTKKGRDLAMRTSDFTTALLPPIAVMGEAEKETMLSGVLRIIRHLNTAGVIPVQRMCFTCSYHRRDFEGHPDFCSLLNTSLRPPEIRLDCPDHKLRVHGETDPVAA